MNLVRLQYGGGGTEIEPYVVTVTLNKDFKGKDVTMSQSGQTPLVKKCPTTSPYVVTFKPMYSGEWVVEAETVSGATSRDTVNLLEWGEYEVTLTSGFDYNGWLTSGRVTKTFASLDAVLADEPTLRQLFTVHDSVDFLSNRCDAETATKIFSNDLCAKWINLRDYALDTLYASAICKSAMDTADKYFYGEWALIDGTWQPKGNVPIMTANDAPYGEVFFSHQYSEQFAGYKAFDNDNTSGWAGNNIDTNEYIGYKFVNPTKVKSFKITSLYNREALRMKDVIVSGSNDGVTYKELFRETLENLESNSTITRNIPEEKADYFIYYKVDLTSHANNLFTVYSLQFYGRELSASVPTMDGNTSPWGEAIGDTTKSGPAPYYAFDKSESKSNIWQVEGGLNDSSWVGYDFKKEIKTEVVYIKPMSAEDTATALSGEFKLQGLVNGVWTDIQAISISASKQKEATIVSITNPIKANAFRILYNKANKQFGSPYYFAMCELQFYGLDYSERDFDESSKIEYIYDHGVEIVELADAKTEGFKYDSYTMSSVEKKTDYIDFLTDNNTFEGAITKEPIDFTKGYSLVRIITCDGKASEQYSYCNILVWATSSKNVSSNLAIGITPQNIGYAEVNTVNQNAYICFGGGASGYLGSKITEIWLERS